MSTQTTPTSHDTPHQQQMWINDDKPTLCAASTCMNGHTWQPQLALTPCGGCRSWVLCLRMIMCPACNEPAITHELRVDHIAHTMKAGAALCRGERCEGEVMKIEMRVQHPTSAPPTPTTEIPLQLTLPLNNHHDHPNLGELGVVNEISELEATR